MTNSSNSLRQYHFPILALAILVMLAAAATMILGVRGVAQSTAQVEHCYRVIAAIHATVATVREAESSARSYRITGSAEQQAEYLAALRPARMQSGEVVAITVGNPDQNAKALQLQQRVQARLQDMAQLVALQNRQGAERAREASTTGTGVALMDELTAVADEMIAREQALLRKRRLASQTRTNLLTTVVVLGLTIPMLLLPCCLSASPARTVAAGNWNAKRSWRCASLKTPSCSATACRSSDADSASTQGCCRAATAPKKPPMSPAM